jgi:hypothetical protein
MVAERGVSNVSLKEIGRIVFAYRAGTAGLGHRSGQFR